MFHCSLLHKTAFNKKQSSSSLFFFFSKQNSSRKNHILPWENYLGKDAAKMCFAHSKICKPGVDENNRFLCCLKLAKSQIFLHHFILTFFQLYRILLHLSCERCTTGMKFHENVQDYRMKYIMDLIFLALIYFTELSLSTSYILQA